MNTKIEYNMAVEFIGSLFKYSTNKAHQNILQSKEIKEDVAKELLDFSPSKEVQEWLEYVDNNISPFFRNDLYLILLKVKGLLDTCFKVVLKNNIKTPLELIDHIKEMDELELLKLIYNEYDLNVPLSSKNETLGKALTKQFDEKTSLFFLQTKKHPKEYKDKTIEALQTFYTLYYKPFENKVYAFMKGKLEDHNRLFQENHMKFLNTIGIGDYSKIIDKEKYFRIFVSFYVDLGLFYFSTDNMFIMFYGHTIEYRFNNKLNLERSKALFKALSDETRLEIIKITSQHPWYNKELAEYFNLSTATLSYHLNLLLDLDILNFEPSANNRYYYTTNKENLKKLSDLALHNILRQ